MSDGYKSGFGLTNIIMLVGAGAGLAVLDAAARGADLRASIGLDSTSRVLLIGTEGATDPEAHRRLLSGM